MKTFLATSAIALLFALLGAWLLRRAQRVGQRTMPLGRSLPDTGTVVFADEDTLNEARNLDRTRLERGPAIPTIKPTGSVCPVCGTMYDTVGARICPKDGAQLLPINA